MHTYELLDSGLGRKLERFGPYIIDRPSLTALWKKEKSPQVWKEAQAVFTREGQNNWQGLENLPSHWAIDVSGIKFKLAPTDFGHLGIFPEQVPFWDWIYKTISQEKRPLQILNLFAYSGGSTLAAAKAGASVCHLDASKGMVAWARENATLNGLEKAPIRWIIDDVNKFLKREINRERRYDGIILDPPSFGRGSKGEVFKIEEDLPPILEMCRTLLTPNPLFILLSCHTPGFTPIALNHFLKQTTNGLKGTIDCGEMYLAGKKDVLTVPNGTFARWIR